MTSSAADISTTTRAKEIPNWTLKADYVESCNCSYGCPCNFTGFPSNGFCSALVGYHIRQGKYGVVKLDDLDAQQEQKDAMINIFSGKAKGNGHFALFASTVKYHLDPQFVDVHMNIDGRRSSFSVPGIIDVKLENFINPVTGDEQDIKIQLPKGFIWKLADAAKTKLMRISTSSLNFDHSGKNAFYSIVDFKGP